MPALIRTITQQDADILGRNVIERTAVNGCVEVHGLAWRSDALRTWELTERRSHREPRVLVSVDELDLSVVFVKAMDAAAQTFKAPSTKPSYTRQLSLYEHEKLKEVLKKKNAAYEMNRTGDEELYRLRLEYYASLGRMDDPVARRRHEIVRDRLAQYGSGLPPPQGAPSPNPPATQPSMAAQKRKRGRPKKSVGGTAPNQAAIDATPVSTPSKESFTEHRDRPAVDEEATPLAERGKNKNLFPTITAKRTVK